MIIVGQAPGPNTDPAEPLSGTSWRRLVALCGLDLPTFLAAFERANLLAAYPGQIGKGDAFPMTFARDAAASMAEHVASKPVVVLLGLNVARAFRLRQPQFFAWTKFSRDCGDVVVVPHPSGISHWWNEPANVRRARRFWHKLTKEMRNGSDIQTRKTPPRH